jgi:predicted transcriptional regulator
MMVLLYTLCGYDINKRWCYQLRRIMAEIVDKELLHYIEARRIYITTDKGYIFLKKE